MIDWTEIDDQISIAIHAEFQHGNVRPLGGGDSNQAWHLHGKDHRQFLVKINAVNRLDMFAAEQAGLEAIAATNTIRVPKPVTAGSAGANSFLVLEFLDMSGRGDAQALGKQLAAMHRSTASQFGWHRNNTIGLTPQPNSWTSGWQEFWREQRLGHQLEEAARNGYRGQLQALGKQVLDALPELLGDHQPSPSLLHGDLWSGNHAYLRNDTPVIFDPATYYGDRETDIAMTELFGGYPAAFYSAYQAAWPLDAGYARRKPLYNLYHVLNHCNMVSSSYVQQAESIMRKLLN